MKIEKFQRKLNETSTEPCLQIYSAGIVQLFLALTVSNGDKREEKLNQVEWWKIPPKELDRIATSVEGDIRTLHLGADPAPKGEEATQGALLSVTVEGPKVVAAVSWRQQRATTFEVVAAAGVRGHVANCVAGLAAT